MSKYHEKNTKRKLEQNVGKTKKKHDDNESERERERERERYLILDT